LIWLLVSRFLVKPIDRHAKLFNRVSIPAPTTTNKGAGIIANVSSEIPDAGESQSESDDDEDVPFDKLPLKLQQKLEHKMRMKLSNKKIRLRRKKLVRKRRMRKRGCWPPSKMKKMKKMSNG
jgi:50S ribosomal protein 5